MKRNVITGGGINCGSDCGQTVNQGTAVGLRAEPSANSIFRKWSGGTGSATVCNDSVRPLCGFTASQSSGITAIFELTP